MKNLEFPKSRRIYVQGAKDARKALISLGNIKYLLIDPPTVQEMNGTKCLVREPDGTSVSGTLADGREALFEMLRLE